MRIRQLLAISVSTGVVALGASGAGAADTVVVGATPASPGSVTLCASGYTIFQDTTAVAPAYTTTAGVVTSWSVMASAPNPGTVALRTALEGLSNVYTITGASESHALVAGRLNTFLTRIPVQAGETIALHVPAVAPSSACYYATANGGDIIRSGAFTTVGDPVGTIVPTGVSLPAVRLDLSAVIEPDADGDGYGDLTQDACPTLRNSHDDCTPPDTFLKSGPPKKLVTKGSKAKVKIAFFASETSTFTCALDKTVAKPCNGTFKATVKQGKHQVTITATDAVGNVDPTPRVVRFKVVRQPA